MMISLDAKTLPGIPVPKALFQYFDNSFTHRQHRIYECPLFCSAIELPGCFNTPPFRGKITPPLPMTSGSAPVKDSL
jgi:hypothetical protein